MKKTEKKVTPKKVVKKVAAKKAVKKIATQKKTYKKQLLKLMVVANNHNSFWMNDGQILNSLEALQQAFYLMEKIVYDYHTANGRNDFANWVEDVLCDVGCADALRKAKTVKSAHNVVAKHLKKYSL